VHYLNDEIGCKTRVYLAIAGWQVDIGQTVLAVPELGGNELLKERVLSSGGDRYVAAVGEGDEAQGVVETLSCGDISGNYGDAADIELGRVEGEHESHGVVGAGVGVEDDFLGCGGRGGGECDGEKKQEQSLKVRRRRKESCRVFQIFSPELIRDSLASGWKLCQGLWVQDYGCPRTTVMP
jgi:hypothetical protein